MATTVDRAMAKAAAVLLPGLLPTPPPPPQSAPCLVPDGFAASNRKPCPCPCPCRADSVERWDAHKNGGKPCSPASSSHGSSSSSSRTSSSSSSKSPSRADSADRWDVKKTSSKSAAVPTSSYLKNSSKRPPSRASSSVDRWDAHKKARSIDDEPHKNETPEMMMARAAGPVFSGPTFVVSPEPSMLPLPALFVMSH